MGIQRKNIGIILTVFFVSLVVRAAVFLQFRGTAFFLAPIMDSALYHDAAIQFAGQGRFTDSLFLMSPMYQVLLSGLYSALGVNLAGIYIIQMLAGSFSAVLLYVIAGRLFNRNIGLIASGLYVLYGGFSVYNLILLPITWIILLNLSMVLALLVAKDRNSRPHYLLAGVIFGLSVMARPNILLFLAFLIPWFYIYSGDRGRNSLNLASFALGLLVALLPFSLLHYRTESRLSPLTSTMGINLYLGNNPDADGIQYIPSPELNNPEKIFEYARAAAESETGTQMELGDVSHFWTKRALGFIFSEPGKSAPLLVRKLLLFWNNHEVSNNYNYYFLRGQMPVLRLLWVNFALLGSLALMGMLTNMRRYRDLFLVYGMVLTYVIALVAFFVLSRYRMAAVPFLILFAAGMVHDIVRERNPVRIAVLAGGFVVLFVLFQMRIIEQDMSAAHVNLGIVYRDRGKYDRAIENFQSAIQIDADDETAYYNLAVVYLDTGNHPLAEENLRAALAIQPDYRKALNGLATLYTKTGRYREAEELFLGLLEANPRDVDAINNLGVLYGRTGDYERAERLFRSALEIEPQNRAALENLDHLNDLIFR